MATQMATLFRALLLLFTLSDSFGRICCLGVGINYGQIANNLPSPSRVAYLLRSLNISRVKLYDADPNVLSSFANSEVEFVIGLGNEYLEKMKDPVQAQSWIQQHVQPYISQTKITCITVGNEILTGNDTQLMSNLFPAMQTIYGALSNLGLSKEVYVTTAHSIGILGNSFPPSAGTFLPDLAEYIQLIINFHSQTKSPFLINAYPFFAYKDNPGQVSLEYVLFQPNPGTMDPITNLKYDNMLYAQIDAVYSAIKAMGRTDVQVKISETGWPSKGDPNEVGATPQNAKLYNSNLLSRLQQNEGTPANPSVPVEVYVFALFNENLKPGPASERNYGLYYPDGTPVYDIGIRGFLPRMAYAASWKNELSFFVLFLSLASLICTL
ncbi:glucan endo-1,3-beta-glucosidase 14 [Olea europaea var. sylvestris]|uniref:glucan endo-1,3-beta-D-glucosidase n=1 Tax=Olea europaea subsp. europaea TaxID=158383 RepID=A0A8S0RXI0_OLEEU|nr:glucan endo-1,3-beta-glucosidase 14 [Olea europaea var. sylvestris]XP_022858657.1 glucan endo-1,3-beta-glucosidase 14 [Olea europaea var. sylvestris]CAA2984838.1 glucan endo-1,3-beta-glucosidase 14 [Olea europaea subsp. europaea]